MPTTAVSDRYVYLKGGLTVPVEPMRLLFDLQERGFSLQADGDDVLVVQPYQRLTTDDCKHIKRWKYHILALLDYPCPEVA